MFCILTQQRYAGNISTWRNVHHYDESPQLRAPLDDILFDKLPFRQGTSLPEIGSGKLVQTFARADLNGWQIFLDVTPGIMFFTMVVGLLRHVN
jgi:hypothetical protein